MVNIIWNKIMSNSIFVTIYRSCVFYLTNNSIKRNYPCSMKSKEMQYEKTNCSYFFTFTDEKLIFI